MNTSSKSTSKATQILPHKCPICGIDTNYVYLVHETKRKLDGIWYRCSCGVVFQEDLPNHSVYNKKYIKALEDAKEYQYRSIHAARTYANLIEELTYGRMFLDVGFSSPAIMNYFEDRGWLTWGIDVNQDISGHDNIYKGDFMTYDFAPQTEDEDVQNMILKGTIKRTFDVIWLSHSLEHFDDPIETIKRIKYLLSPDGVVFISTPDIDFINKTGVGSFPHWNKQEHYVMWSEPALKREFERAGFKTIMSRRNFSSRFTSWYDVHAIFQRNYF